MFVRKQIFFFFLTKQDPATQQQSQPVHSCADTVRLKLKFREKKKNSVNRGVKIRPFIFKRSLTKTITHTCNVNTSQHNHTFDAQMAYVNFVIPPAALPLLFSTVIYLSLSVSHIPHVPYSSFLSSSSCVSLNGFLSRCQKRSTLAYNSSRLNLINQALWNWRARWERRGWVNVSWNLWCSNLGFS